MKFDLYEARKKMHLHPAVHNGQMKRNNHDFLRGSPGIVGELTLAG